MILVRVHLDAGLTGQFIERIPATTRFEQVCRHHGVVARAEAGIRNRCR
jgi:hypothetical protein